MESERQLGAPFRLLFVCTGNTCRSPMAEAIARRALERIGWRHVVVASAGVGAWGGEPASGGALRTARRHGLDLADHRASPLTREAASDADLILAMSPSHLLRLVDLGVADKSALLTAFAAGDGVSDAPESVSDPFGGPDEAYEDTFLLLERLVEQTLRRLTPIVSP